jgi:hypothetical protein
MVLADRVRFPVLLSVIQVIAVSAKRYQEFALRYLKKTTLAEISDTVTAIASG